MRYPTDPFGWDMQAELAISPSGEITPAEVLAMMAAALDALPDMDHTQSARHLMEQARKLAESGITSREQAGAWAYNVEHFARDLEAAQAAVKASRPGKRRPKFSAQLVVNEIRRHLKPNNCDHLLQLWRDGIQGFGEHEIECGFDGAFYCYVNNDESPYYKPNKKTEFEQATIMDRWERGG